MTVCLSARLLPKSLWQLFLGRGMVRSEKTCEREGESPSSLEAGLPEFKTTVMNGKV